MLKGKLDLRHLAYVILGFMILLLSLFVSDVLKLPQASNFPVISLATFVGTAGLFMMNYGLNNTNVFQSFVPARIKISFFAGVWIVYAGIYLLLK